MYVGKETRHSHCINGQVSSFPLFRLMSLRYWLTDLQGKVADECVQLHGGWGFMWEFPVARAFCDGRVQRIYGGTNEIMKELIARGI
jgi:alkylation response protein AidB-like acyl-CoA dehydrogenase